MKEKEIKITLQELDRSELQPDELRLVEMAEEMTYGAYAPYSHFRVGAAIQLANGEVCTGSNQENAAFPSGTCAERTACFHASAMNPGVRMLRIAIAARGKDGELQQSPISPCGACRQALLEYEHRDGPMEVLLVGRDKVYRLPSVATLLPLAFSEF